MSLVDYPYRTAQPLRFTTGKGVHNRRRQQRSCSLPLHSLASVLFFFFVAFTLHELPQEPRLFKILCFSSAECVTQKCSPEASALGFTNQINPYQVFSLVLPCVWPGQHFINHVLYSAQSTNWKTPNFLLA